MSSPSALTKVNYLAIRRLHFESVLGDLQEGHDYASRCQSPLFSSTKLPFLCAFASKFFPMAVRRGSMLVVSSRWRSLMMTLAHSPAYRPSDQQYLCHGALASSISAGVRRGATKHHREEPAGRDCPKPAQRSRAQKKPGTKEAGNKKNRA